MEIISKFVYSEVIYTVVTTTDGVFRVWPNSSVYESKVEKYDPKPGDLEERHYWKPVLYESNDYQSLIALDVV